MVSSFETPNLSTCLRAPLIEMPPEPRSIADDVIE
jgi:hypothetical protein